MLVVVVCGVSGEWKMFGVHGIAMIVASVLISVPVALEPVISKVSQGSGHALWLRVASVLISVALTLEPTTVRGELLSMLHRSA